MSKIGRPPKKPSEVKVTASYCISKKNKAKIKRLAKISGHTSVAAYVDELFDRISEQSDEHP